MSEGDVSLIHDEDVLRRMWQQTEDFSRKKEIRAHMYRLREERLRNLYSPEPPHARADTKDLKALSNAGWNVESENKKTDDGHTHVKSVNANIEGRYDVEGGKGHFAAIDQHKQAVTEYHDDNTSLKRNESSSNTAAREHVVRQTDDGTQVSSVTSSSTSTSKYQQMSSTKHETVPYLSNDDYDQSQQTSYDTNRNEQFTAKRQVTQSNDYEHSLRKTDFETGELESRKVEYPDENTRIVVETRCLPDGTRVTSTRREFRAPVVQSSRSEQHSQQTRSENKSSYSTSSQQRSDFKESSSKVIQENFDNRVTDIVDSQRYVDDNDFKRNHQTDYSQTEKDHTDRFSKSTERHTEHRYHESTDHEPILHETFTSQNRQNVNQHDVHETQYINKDREERVHDISTENKVEETTQKKISNDQYQTTYQTEFTQKNRVSNDWSPTHQAWASTLRADTPTSTRPSTRASSPGGRTFQSSTSSLRSSVSPDKTYRKPSSRGGSPNKIDRYSPTRSMSDKYSSTHSTYSVTDTKTNRYTSSEERTLTLTTNSDQKRNDERRQRPSISPDKRPRENYRSSESPDRKPTYRTSPMKEISRMSPNLQPKHQEGPHRPSTSPDRKPVNNTTNNIAPKKPQRSNISPEKKPKNDCDNISKASSPTKPLPKDDIPLRSSQSPNRKPGYQIHDTDRDSKNKILNEEKTKENYPSTTSPKRPSTQHENAKRPSLSPEKIPSDYKRTSSPRRSVGSPEKEISPTRSHSVRPSSSPERKPVLPSNTNYAKPADDKELISPTRGSISPDRRPGYMKPTAVSQRSSNIPEYSPNRQLIAQSPESNVTERTVSKIKEDHYKFVDEETKVYDYTKSDTRDTTKQTISTPKYPGIHEKSQSPSMKLPQDVPDFCHSDSPPRSTLRKDSRSPSPSKGSVTFKHLDNVKTTGKISSITNISTDMNENIDVTEYEVKKHKDISTPTKNNIPRESSPSKFGTYDKKQRHFQDNQETKVITSKDTKYDSLTRREKSTSPKKDHDSLTSTHRKTPSVSPVKSVSKDSKYNQTIDLISTEKTREEINRTNKGHTRQLVTPSTSPTRKPKTSEPEPSTGQSSPTTSVSGFVYFSSPRIDNTIVTDLDDQQFCLETDEIDEVTTSKRPETLDVNTKRSPSPSKIPCRSPAQEKHTSPTRDNLPRKSSLKKPTLNNNLISPVEKPPSSFQVSPTVETQDLPEHKIIKKDHPEKPDSDSSIKSKPPLKRRETYDERCRKILGMVEDQPTSVTTITKETLQTLGSNKSSPSVSPCGSPKQESPYREVREETKNNNINVSEFITQERENNIKTRYNDTVPGKKSKIPSRESSPTKVQGITLQTNTTTTFEETCRKVDENITTEINNEYSITKHNIQPKPESNLQSTSPSYEKHQIEGHPKNEFLSKPSQISSKKPESRQQTPPNRSRTSSPTKILKENQDIKPTNTPDRKQPLTIDINDIPKSTALKEKSTHDEPKLDVISSKITDKNDTIYTTQENTEMKSNKICTTKSSISPTQKVSSTKQSSTDLTNQFTSTKQPLESKHSRTPSPSKTNYSNITENNTSFITSEREQEILNRVQQSLRKLSPKRNERSPSREKSPSKTTTSLQDLEISTVSLKTSTENINEEDNKNYLVCAVKSTKKDDKLKDQKISSKPPSRNISPAKKPTNIATPTKTRKSSDSPTKSRSISPKKSVSTERPQSPQLSKVSGIKPRETIPSHLTRKPTPGSLSPTKLEKTTTTDIKKNIKQNSFSKTTSKITSNKLVQSATNKSVELETRPTTKTNKENTSPKTDINVPVTRSPSDVSLKYKRPSPQRVKSKPEIQINDISTSKTKQINLTANKIQKSSPKEVHPKLPNKPKSATALNTVMDDDDIIIDVQQAKSSRENSPDRICPTPIGFNEDIGTPRFPDEVSEPDDDFRKRTHHTIHETESIVDDIVEISEDDELFAKRTNDNTIIETDECHLSVNDKVSKFTNKIESVTKTKQSTNQFKDTERKVHSDYISEEFGSDDCLLSVSEKVNKFAKGPESTKDNRSPTRKIVDEYDTNTTYQDDYTKLSVNDKAHLFVETAEYAKTPKIKSSYKIERPDMSDVDESLKRDDCLLSVSDKVNKFVKTAEQFLNETTEVEEKERKIKEEHDKIMKKITNEVYDSDINKIDISKTNETITLKKDNDHVNKLGSFSKETVSSQAKLKDHVSSNLKPTEKTPPVKITMRSNVAVKKAKALFENIASTNQKNTDITHSKTTKLTDIGVIKKSPKTDSTIVLHPSLQNSPNITDIDSEIDGTPQIQQEPKDHLFRNTSPQFSNKEQNPNLLRTQSPEVSRNKSPARQILETTTKTVSSKYPPKEEYIASEKEKSEKPQDKIPGYLRPTKTSQYKEEVKVIDETEVSSRRGSGKFGVELRRTSMERSSASSERRRSVDHHQPCIEDIFDLDLLEQMLEKVVGYEQRRRIRAQIRIAKKKLETDMNMKTSKQVITNISKNKSPDRQITLPDVKPKSTSQRILSPERHIKTETVIENKSKESHLLVVNDYSKEQTKTEKHSRPQSPEKNVTKPISKARSPMRQASPEKKSRPLSPSKTTTPKTKQNRFNEYASAYMKKVGLKDSDKTKVTDIKTKKATETSDHKISNHEEHLTKSFETREVKTIKSQDTIKRTSSKDTIEIVHTNGKRTPSPEKKRSPERIIEIQIEKEPRRSPSPVIKRQKSDVNKNETTVKQMPDIGKKIQPKQTQEEKPSWVTNRNLKKVTETRTYGTKKLEPEKPKYRAPSPSKVISKPTDVITSSYGPGPLDANGKPLFGIKALRNGATNYQVKGTVIRQEFHSRNGGEPEGTVSVTAYSNEPEELERLLQAQGERPSRMHGLAAITTTKKFGGDTGTTMREAHTKEERAALEQFTHSDRRVTNKVENVMSGSFDKRENSFAESKKIEDRSEDRWKRTEDRQQKTQEKQERSNDRRQRIERREDKKTVRQSSVKSLTEKYIKSASETNKSERVSYPKAGLILRTATMKDSFSSDSSAHAGLARTDSDHSLASVEDVVTTSTTERGDGRTVTTTTTTRRSHHGQEKSFLDSSTKVTGVQDILTRMKNADIVIQEGDSTEDSEARALLNKFLGATVLMAGMQNYVTEKPAGKVTVRQETVRSSGGKVTSERSVQEFDIEQCWDERVLRKLLDECSDYEQRRRLRARLRTLMAEQEACASAVTEALAAAGEGGDNAEGNENEAREEEKVTTVTSSVRRNSSEKTVSSSTTTKTSKVSETVSRPASKQVSPFAKFRQLEKQNSVNSPNSPKTPQSPGSPSQPYFKFTDPTVQASALTIKERLLQWCRDKTRDYENVKLENFSTSWADGLAFCALVHHFLPNTFDYSKLTPEKRRANFTLAFKVADEKAGIYPLLDVDDMVAMRKPDWKCVFTYVQSIHRRFKDED
ncbi:microtubule-associated protein futsch isoform X2 [Galleria mellonella]|uniref:Microtubule-associated protein futsch isoform X2 n=1 Tax=Galleria mellonella TaxID=7137 RepID=A0ABM3MPR9_GALME|nr:microtubule-associated protein futsch isoform X2 [Galleria mellonella]